MKSIRPLVLSAVAALALSTGAALAERGSDGTLDLLFWQAPSGLNPYIISGSKDVLAASLVLESLARFDPDGTPIPYLSTDIPTLANGGISEDLTEITWTLKPGLKWSDGTDVTAEDVVFTWEFCMAEGSGCAQTTYFSDVANVEAIDADQVKITFTAPTTFPYRPFVGYNSPVLQKEQFKDCLGAQAASCSDENFNPVGTGPFVVNEFRANDVITLDANPYYRDADKPAFANVVIKGGGDAASAARAVLETGEYDLTWNLQVEPEILEQMEAAGKGRLMASLGTGVERLEFNQFNPDPELGDLRSTKQGGPHPFLTDPAVVKALSMAIDRSIIVAAGYGAAGVPTCNLLAAPEIYASDQNDWCLTQDIDGANALLDEAGWVRGGDGIRAKDGVRLSILFATGTNSVRKASQQLIKSWWSKIGVETELRNVSPSVFFGGDAASPDTVMKFYADVVEYNRGFPGTDPSSYMAYFTCDDIPRPESNWMGNNIPRYCDPEYDALVEELNTTVDTAKRTEILKRLNDMLVQSGAIVPLVHRGGLAAASNTLEGVIMNAWESEFWNIADWTRAK